MAIDVNPWVSNLEAYVPGEQPIGPGWTKLNTNENPYPPAPLVMDAIRDYCDSEPFNKYPDPTSSKLREAIATQLGVTPRQVLAGNGSDEILRLICHAFLRADRGDILGMTDPTYVLYETLGAMFGCRRQTFASMAPEYALNSELMDADVKILFLPNPNPPIGTWYENEELASLAGSMPNRLLVIDEAYVDFAPGHAVDVLREHSNVIITRTFSKSYSLAGLRIGFMIAGEELISEVTKIKDSYNLNGLSQVAALAAWNSGDYYSERCKQIIADRAFLREELLKRGFVVPESEGNFLFARKPNARDIYLQLKSRKVLVRYFDTPRLQDGIRITIGTREELSTFLAALDEIM